MNNEQLKESLLNHINEVRQVSLIDAASKLNIPLIKAQWAAKVLEDEKKITSEKTEKGKLVKCLETIDTTESKPRPNIGDRMMNSSYKIKPKPTTRDTSKYIFEKSKPMAKGQCVLAIMKSYFRDKKPTFKEVKSTFDDSIVQRYGISQELSTAKKLSVDRDRYFFKDGQVLTTKDGKKIAITSQWTAERFDNFLKIARKLGYSVKSAT